MWPTRFTIVGAAVCALCCGCADQGPVTAQEKAAAVPLTELSREQLRTWLKGVPGDWRTATDQANGKPAPPSVKALPEGTRCIDLAEPDLDRLGQQPLAQAIAHRRSRRDYSKSPLTLEQLGFLLWSAQGISGADFDEQGTVQQLYRTTPSGGGRQPLETYIAVQRVEGLAPGLYRYRPAKHQLALLNEADLNASLKAACYGSEAVNKAAAVLIWTCIPYRTEWRYGSIAHRMIAMEAGHACQNLYLAAEALELGACAMLAYDQPRMDALTGVDGRDEFVLYLATLGKVD